MTTAAHSPAIENWRPPARRAAAIAFVVGAALLGLCLILALFAPQRVFQAYLYGYLYWWTATMGCLALALLHNLTGGAWGSAIRPFLYGGIATLAVLAVMFLPLTLGLPQIFEWAHFERFDPALAQDDPILADKVNHYLNIPFFLVRAVVYFVIWFGAAAIARRGARRASALALSMVILGISFASIDWGMSLEPHWFSTIYGGLFLAGGAVSAMALSIVSVGALSPPLLPHDRRSADVTNDLGNLLLAFVMVWTYFSFSQFIIIWSGNLPEENVWYLRRSVHGWQWVAIAIALFHFAAPFLLLLSRDLKRNPKTLMLVALGLLVMRSIDLFWIIVPAFENHGWTGFLLDFLALAGIGAIWVGVYCWSLKPLPEAGRHHAKRSAKRKGAVA